MTKHWASFINHVHVSACVVVLTHLKVPTWFLSRSTIVHSAVLVTPWQGHFRLFVILNHWMSVHLHIDEWCYWTVTKYAQQEVPVKFIFWHFHFPLNLCRFWNNMIYLRFFVHHHISFILVGAWNSSTVERKVHYRYDERLLASQSTMCHPLVVHRPTCSIIYPWPGVTEFARP